jgi:hypothetical protein
MNPTAWSAQIPGLLDALGSFAQEKDVLARIVSFRVSVLTEMKRQENRSPGPGPLARLMPADEIKLGEVVYRLPCEGFDHVRP